ncbi:MAG: hypothetical protein ACLUSV_08645 [Streptococcus sp.]
MPLSYHLALPDFSAGAGKLGTCYLPWVYLLVDENSSAKPSTGSPCCCSRISSPMVRQR